MSPLTLINPNLQTKRDIFHEERAVARGLWNYTYDYKQGLSL